MPAKAEIRPTIENKEIGVPRVTYLGDINKENSPYSLYINAPLFGQLLQEEFGMTPEQIEKLDIAVVGRGGKVKPHGLLDTLREKLPPRVSNVSQTRNAFGRRRITIYPQTYYESLINMREVFLRYSRYSKNDWEEFGGWGMKAIKSVNNLFVSHYAKDFFVTKRLLPYLSQAEPERSEKFLEKLIPKAMRRKFLGLLAHEGKHAADTEKEKHALLKKLGMLTGAMITIDLGISALFNTLEVKDPAGFKFVCAAVPLTIAATLGIVYYLPPGSERDAILAEKAVKKKYRWLDCVKFQVNERQDL